DVGYVMEQQLVDTSAGQTNQPQIGEDVAFPWRPEKGWPAAPQQPLPREWDVLHGGLRRPEVDFRDLPRLRWGLEERVFFESEQLCREVRGKLTSRRVVFLDALVIPHTFDGNAILGSGKFVHQTIELFVGFELRVVLRDRQQAAQRAGLLVGGLDRLFG